MNFKVFQGISRFNGFEWMSMDVNGCQWISMDLNGFAWIFRDIKRFLCNSR